MKKITVVLLILIALCFASSCDIFDYSSDFVYNGNKYIKGPYDDVHYNFLGDYHFVVKVSKGFITRYFYCLDSDIEENVLFEPNLGRNTYWYKQGFDFPDESTIADKVRIKRYDLINDEMNETIYDCLSDVSFNDVFFEITNQEIKNQLFYYRSSHPAYIITFLYGNIERVHNLCIYDDNIYIGITVYFHDDEGTGGESHWYMVDEKYETLFFDMINTSH